MLEGYAARPLDGRYRAVLIIWNGRSPGTQAGYAYAVQRGKLAHLIAKLTEGFNFDREPKPYG